MKLGMVVGLAPATLFHMGTQLLPPKKRGHPQFSAHVRCGQTAGLIKILFGMKVGLGPGDFVLDRGPVPPKKGTQPPIFGPCLL